MYYLYKITYWDIDFGAEKIDKGIVHAKHYGKAAMKVLNDYDPKSVIDIYLQEIDAENTINEDELSDAFKS